MKTITTILQAAPIIWAGIAGYALAQGIPVGASMAAALAILGQWAALALAESHQAPQPSLWLPPNLHKGGRS